TRGIIMGRSGIRAAYATGRGKVVVRARTEFEDFGNGRTRIIVTELPYQVNKRQLIKSIADQVKEKKLDGISDLRDETDRNGMRIVIELKKDANGQVVLNNLFKQTALQSNFSIILLALVNNQKQPKVLTLRQILDEYLKFQKEIIVRRTRYDLRKAMERAHLLAGLIIAQDNIDEVIRIIRTSYDDAKENLMARFDLDEVQAQAILDMRLKALQGLDREKLQAEMAELQEKIAYYNRLLASDEMIAGVLKEELTTIAAKFGDERRTDIQDVEDELDIEDLIEEEDCVFTLTRMGYIKRIPTSVYRAQRRGGRGVNAMTTREEDIIGSLFVASTHDHILCFTNRGRLYRLKGYQVPEAARTAKGTNMVNLLQLEPDEKVTALLHTREFDEDTYVVMVTLGGTVKRISLAALNSARKAGIRAISLDEGDLLLHVMLTDGEKDVLVVSKGGRAVCFEETDVRCMGREAAGVRAIRLEDGDEVIGAVVAEKGRDIVTISEMGFGKRTEESEFTRHSRGGKGMTAHKLTDKTGTLAGVLSAAPEEDLLLITDCGTMIRTSVEDIRLCGRSSQGVIVMRTAGEEKVIATALTDKESAEETEA
ncbi:MAG: DNA gyrase subunit A, partial [Clostridia bacterium]|nr:DNA gyrase subunit A [Clostridia bacterium]